MIPSLLSQVVAASPAAHKFEPTYTFKEDGQPMRAYLMAIDEDLYQEDQAEKQKEVDQIDTHIHSGAIGGTKPGQDGRYVKDINYKP